MGALSVGVGRMVERLVAPLALAIIDRVFPSDPDEERVIYQPPIIEMSWEQGQALFRGLQDFQNAFQVLPEAQIEA